MPTSKNLNFVIVNSKATKYKNVEFFNRTPFGVLGTKSEWS